MHSESGMKAIIIFFLLVTNLAYGQANQESTENIILISIDGLRWQEVFRGLDINLASNEEYSSRSEYILKEFKGNDSAEKLMPFLHQVVMKEGSIIGNKDKSSCAQVTNPWYFSYPGYNEILTGRADPEINSNSAIANPNVTFLEWLNKKQPAFENSVVAFSSWDVFPFIINTERSGVPVNIGPKENPENEFEKTLNRLSGDIPSPWKTVRLDAFTHHYALSYMKAHHPRVTYIAYGETDDFAHDGEYDQYVIAANRTDRFIREIWEFIQQDNFYQNKTTLMITSDHGRGEYPEETWQHHASKKAMKGYMESLAEYEEGIVGSENVWIAAFGPGIKQQGLIETGESCVGSNQVAASLLYLLDFDYKDFNPDAGKPIMEMVIAQ